MKLLNQYYHDETISSYLIEINEILIQRYQEKLKQKQDNKIKWNWLGAIFKMKN